MNKLGVLTLISCVMALWGCGAQPGTGKWFEEGGRGRLSKRAAFEMSCSPDELRFAPLSTGLYEYKQVGVSGCGKKATYIVRVLPNGAGTEWIAN